MLNRLSPFLQQQILLVGKIVADERPRFAGHQHPVGPGPILPLRRAGQEHGPFRHEEIPPDCMQARVFQHAGGKADFGRSLLPHGKPRAFRPGLHPDLRRRIGVQKRAQPPAVVIMAVGKDSRVRLRKVQSHGPGVFQEKVRLSHIEQIPLPPAFGQDAPAVFTAKLRPGRAVFR